MALVALLKARVSSVTEGVSFFYASIGIGESSDVFCTYFVGVSFMNYVDNCIKFLRFSSVVQTL